MPARRRDALWSRASSCSGEARAAGRLHRGGLPRRRRGQPRRSGTWPRSVRLDGARLFEVQPGVLARACDTVTPQPVAAIVGTVDVDLAELDGRRPIWSVICVDVRDPGQPGHHHPQRGRRRRQRRGLLCGVGRPVQPEDGPRLGRACSSICPWSSPATRSRCSTELRPLGAAALGDRGPGRLRLHRTST